MIPATPYNPVGNLTFWVGCIRELHPVSLSDTRFVRPGYSTLSQECRDQAAIHGGTVNTGITRFTVGK